MTAFDGANVWTSNTGDGTVTKLRASDGKVLGTFKVGSRPFGMAFDGVNIWVANDYDATVSKLRASDGKVMGSSPLALVPYGVVFDGTSMWVTTGEGVWQLRLTDGVRLCEVPNQEVRAQLSTEPISG